MCWSKQEQEKKKIYLSVAEKQHYNLVKWLNDKKPVRCAAANSMKRLKKKKKDKLPIFLWDQSLVCEM